VFRENEYFDPPCVASSVPVNKAGVLTELRRREFYENLPNSVSEKAAAVKRHLKRLSRRLALQRAALPPAPRRGSGSPLLLGVVRVRMSAKRITNA